MDANSKLIPEYLKNNPNDQSQNGKLLVDGINRYALIVVNGMAEKLIGVITREKLTVYG